MNLSQPFRLPFLRFTWPNQLSYPKGVSVNCCHSIFVPFLANSQCANTESEFKKINICLSSENAFYCELISVQKFVLELCIRNQVMCVKPKVDEVRGNLLRELSSFRANILTLAQASDCHSFQFYFSFCFKTRRYCS